MDSCDQNKTKHSQAVISFSRTSINASPTLICHTSSQGFRPWSRKAMATRRTKSLFAALWLRKTRIRPNAIVPEFSGDAAFRAAHHRTVARSASGCRRYFRSSPSLPRRVHGIAPKGECADCENDLPPEAVDEIASLLAKGFPVATSFQLNRGSCWACAADDFSRRRDQPPVLTGGV